MNTQRRHDFFPALVLVCTSILAFVALIQPWSLRQDRQLRRDTRQALADHGVEISLGEGFLVRPGADIRASAGPDLEAMRELEVRCINVVSIEPDFGRNVEQFGALLELARPLGMEATLEFGPIFGIRNLASALEALQAVGSPGFRLLVDVLHLVRSGATAADLAALGPSARIVDVREPDEWAAGHIGHRQARGIDQLGRGVNKRVQGDILQSWCGGLRFNPQVRRHPAKFVESRRIHLIVDRLRL